MQHALTNSGQRPAVLDLLTIAKDHAQYQDPPRSNRLETPLREPEGQTASKTGHSPTQQKTKTKTKKKKKKERNDSKYVTKEQCNNLQDQINEEEIGNIPEKEFKVMITKTFQDMKNRWRKYKKHLT